MEEIKKIMDKVQMGEIITKEENNKLWNYCIKEFNILTFLKFYNNGLYYKSKIINTKYLKN